MKPRTLRTAFAFITLVSFSVLLFFGKEIYREKPPVPEKVITESGEVLFTAQQIKDGQNVWQSTGGQEPGTVWGQGDFVAPDLSEGSTIIFYD